MSLCTHYSLPTVTLQSEGKRTMTQKKTQQLGNIFKPMIFILSLVDQM